MNRPQIVFGSSGLLNHENKSTPFGMDALQTLGDTEEKALTIQGEERTEFLETETREATRKCLASCMSLYVSFQ